jgi:hypothetical protein
VRVGGFARLHVEHADVEKKRSICCDDPNWKMEAFSRKNGRFSGKNSSKRVRFTCSLSASTCAKSVFTVTSAVSLGVIPHFTSRPTSPVVLLGSTAKRLSRE